MTKGLHKNSLRKVDNPHQWMIDDARMELIQQIKAEIERQRKSIENAKGDFAEGRRMEQINMLSVLNTLEEEPVELEKLIEDELDRRWLIKRDVDGNVVNGVHDWKKSGNLMNFPCVFDIARHFYNLGRGSSEKPNDLPTNLDEAAENYKSMCEHYLSVTDGDDEKPKEEFAFDGFKAGAMWDREQGVSMEGVASRKYDRQYHGFPSILVCDESAMVNQLIPQDTEAKVIVQIRKKDE